MSVRIDSQPIIRDPAGRQKIRLFNAVHLELGYKPLQIYSPRQVTHYGEADD
jgi:hypothetical protein